MEEIAETFIQSLSLYDLLTGFVVTVTVIIISFISSKHESPNVHVCHVSFGIFFLYKLFNREWLQILCSIYNFSIVIHIDSIHRLFKKTES